MAHFAQLNDDNYVIQVIKLNDPTLDSTPFPDSEEIGVAFCKSLYGNNTIWKQTSYNKNFREIYAGIGGFYDHINDIFVKPKKYSSWIYNYTTRQWESPIPHPNQNFVENLHFLDTRYPKWIWSEEKQIWEETVKPYPSWSASANGNGSFWVAPVPTPNISYSLWNEETQSYVRNDLIISVLFSGNTR